jgi:hypothetical protein
MSQRVIKNQFRIYSEGCDLRFNLHIFNIHNPQKNIFHLFLLFQFYSQLLVGENFAILFNGRHSFKRTKINKNIHGCNLPVIKEILKLVLSLELC